MQIVKEQAYINQRCHECYKPLYCNPENRDYYVVRVVYANVDGRWNLCFGCLNKLFNKNEIRKVLKEE